MITSETVLASVMEDVRSELGSLDKAFSAELAGVWFVSGVSTHMTIEGFFSCETTIAFLAFIRSFACVHSTVLLHCATRWESFRTHGALVRALTSMSTHMNRQQSSPVEFLLTFCAGENLLPLRLSSMASQMFPQIIPSHKLFLADLTLIDSSRFAIAACLGYVTLQVVFAAEHFVAAFARKRLLQVAYYVLLELLARRAFLVAFRTIQAFAMDESYVTL